MLSSIHRCFQASSSECDNLFDGVSFTLVLTHWGPVTHICVSKPTIIGSDNGLSPGRCWAIIWTNAGMLLIRTVGTNFNEILNQIHNFNSRICIWKCRLRNGGNFFAALMCDDNLIQDQFFVIYLRDFSSRLKVDCMFCTHVNCCQCLFKCFIFQELISAIT